MPSVTLRNLGGSVVLAVPKKILNLVHLDAGSRVEISVQNGRLVIEPPKKPRYTLAELLSRCRPTDLRPRRKDKQWLQSPPAGRELL
jgi:antitoxin ChpS